MDIYVFATSIKVLRLDVHVKRTDITVSRTGTFVVRTDSIYGMHKVENTRLGPPMAGVGSGLKVVKSGHHQSNLNTAYSPI